VAGVEQGRMALDIQVSLLLAGKTGIGEVFSGCTTPHRRLTAGLGVDRDSAIVAPIFGERNPGVKSLTASVIAKVQAKGCKVGICGQAPSDYLEFARFLVEQRIDSISLNPDVVLRTTLDLMEMEKSSAGP
jgi:pyruvate,water dikinase